MNHEHHEPREGVETPAELKAIESRLNALASAEARRVPAGLEDRLFQGSRGVLVEAPASLRFPAPGRWRLAAAVLLVAGAGIAAAFYVGSRGSTPGAGRGTGQMVQRTPVGEPAIVEGDDLQSEIEALLSTYDEVRGADLARATPMGDGFWGEDVGLSTEDTTQ